MSLSRPDLPRMAEKYVSCSFAVVRVGWWTTGANEFDTAPALHDLVLTYRAFRANVMGWREGDTGLRKCSGSPHRTGFRTHEASDAVLYIGPSGKMSAARSYPNAHQPFRHRGGSVCPLTPHLS